MARDDIDFAALSESIQRGAAAGDGGASAVLRRLALLLARPQARHQLTVDRQLLDALKVLSADTVSSEALEELRTWLHNHNDQLEHLSANLEGVHGAIAELREWNNNLGRHTEDLGRRTEDLGRRLGPLESFIAASRAAPDPDAVGLERFNAGPAGTVLGYRDGGDAVADADAYVAFEDVFRLSEEVIRERQRPYLELLGGRRPVLDVGSGRGEFLELLREAGIPGRGVDLDPGMVSRSRAKGLDVELGDGVTYLEGLPDGSLGTVFAAQVVEHLPYERLIAFLRLSASKLAPGGLLIAETVNPHAPGALKNFWFDLTHQHPIFPEVLLTLCRSAGLRSGYVFHPGGSGDVDADRERMGDYAVVASRAAEV